MAFTPLDRGSSWTLPAAPARWRAAADGTHRVLATAVLGGAAAGALAWPQAGTALAPWSGAALLVGGALIGVPHGSSDFVVAHRVMRPRFGRAWLPVFLVAYLSLVAAVMVGWTLAPLATLLLFVGLSGLHFGRGDLRADERRDGLAVAVRATTPLLPVLLVHAAGVAPLVAALAGAQATAVAGVLEGLRWLLVPWGLAVACTVLGPCTFRPGPPARTGGAGDAAEVGAIAAAAVVLPPLLGFALYFCLVHAVRHMIGIADDHRPGDARRATLLAGAIVAPSALVCLALLGLTWAGIGGTLGTTDVLAWSLRLIAALTVPHMALEAWAERSTPERRRA